MPTTGPDKDSPFKDYFSEAQDLSPPPLSNSAKAVIPEASLSDTAEVQRLLAKPKIEGVCQNIPEKELDSLNLTAKWLCMSSIGNPVKVFETGRVQALIAKCDAWLRKDETLSYKARGKMLERIEQALKDMVALSGSTEVTLKITAGFIPTELVWNTVKVSDRSYPVQMLLVLGCEQAKIVTPRSNVLRDRFNEFRENNGKEILVLERSGGLDQEAFARFVKAHAELGEIMLGQASPPFLADPGQILPLPAQHLYVLKADGAGSEGVLGRAPLEVREHPGLRIQIAA